MSVSSDFESQETIEAIQEFAKSAAWISSRQPNLVEAYPSQWIGVCRKNIEASADDLDRLFEQLKEKGIPLGTVNVQFICEEKPILILPGIRNPSTLRARLTLKSKGDTSPILDG